MAKSKQTQPDNQYGVCKVTETDPGPGAGPEVEEIKALRLAILKYIYLNFETSVKRRKEERRGKKEKRKQVNIII